MKPSLEQSRKIQILRGIAIVAVVFIHNTPEGLSQVFVRPFLNFCVGLFLFLSGLLSSADNWKPIKRITKIGIPYVIWTLVYIVLHNYKTPSVILTEYIKGLIFADSAAVMYFVFVYCQFTLLTPVIDKLARSRLMIFGYAITPLEILFIRILPIWGVII